MKTDKLTLEQLDDIIDSMVFKQYQLKTKYDNETDKEVKKKLLEEMKLETIRQKEVTELWKQRRLKEAKRKDTKK